jgi:hypothetical protein
MARNYVDLIVDHDSDDFDSFEKLGHTNKRKYNKVKDPQERIKQQRRQRQKMKEDTQKTDFWEEY